MACYRPVSGFVLVTGALLAILASGASLAHHSRAPFNMEALIAFEGTVVQYRWRNPHVYIIVKDRNGAEWLLETDATPVMSRSGWTRDSFAPGDSVTVRIRPDRNPSKYHGLLESIAGDDGRLMASMNLGEKEGIEIIAARSTSLAGVWAGKRLEAFKVFPPAADIAVTAAGAEGRRLYDESQNPAADCVPLSGLIFMWANWIYLTEVELGDDIIVLRNEFYGAERTIYMDGREHPENGERTIQGHSIGHWEGDTLVIDSTLFADYRSSIPNTGIPSGEKKHLVERLTLSDDGQTALYEFMVEDADYLAEPLSGEYTWHYVPHLEFITLECELDNARRFIQ
jgi:hypothetical protein